ncbi:hypothetical protein BDQ17DRAFT_1237811 [Cyathus striatus]|nr:hypothetical protein BDQ17DRAFT_1237811 [Cyathus striatus]
MYIFWLAALVLSTFSLGKASQASFKYEGHDNEFLPSSDNNDHWNLYEEPPQNSTSHLIFDTMNSLVQHWTNTRYRNGHTIIPATIPTGTILYHGTYTTKFPINPEWVATDAEHARYFCQGLGTYDNNQGCWQLTLAVTSPLRILYFDGSSAAKLDDGPLDTQDILLWGQSRPNMVFREEIRICGLCDWGRKYGIHGFMRMQMDFEIMLCNFTRDVEVVSFLNLATEILVGMGADTMEVGTWHNHYPGDTRVMPDLSRAISFYDIHTFPSLVARRLGKERWYHRADGLSVEDLQTLRKRLDEVLADDKWGGAPAVDWRAQFHVITNRYAERLETLRYMVTNITDTQRAADRAFEHLRKLLSPYRLHAAIPSSITLADTSNHSWAIPVFKLCATTHTSYLSKLPNLTPSETMLLHAMEDVNKEICRVVVKLWAEGVERGLVPWKEITTSEDELRELLDGWKDKVNGLMKWLDWSVWIKCPEPCGPEQMCFMPTWPYFLSLKGHMPIPLRPLSGQVYVLSEQSSPDTPDALKSPPWHKPQPRCVRKFPPYNDMFT